MSQFDSQKTTTLDEVFSALPAKKAAEIIESYANLVKFVGQDEKSKAVTFTLEELRNLLGTSSGGTNPELDKAIEDLRQQLSSAGLDLSRLEGEVFGDGYEYHDAFELATTGGSKLNVNGTTSVGDYYVSTWLPGILGEGKFDTLHIHLVGDPTTASYAAFQTGGSTTAISPSVKSATSYGGVVDETIDLSAVTCFRICAKANTEGQYIEYGKSRIDINEESIKSLTTRMGRAETGIESLRVRSKTDYDGNMNNCLDQGVYPYCTDGRPAGSTGYYTLVVRKSTTADNNGYYTVEQTAYGRNEDEGKVYKRIIFVKENGDTDYHDWINCSSALNRLAFSGVLKADTVAQDELDAIMNDLAANQQAWYVIGNSAGATSGGTVTFSSVLAKLVHPEDTRGVAANLGDFIMFAKDASGNKLYRVIPVNDAKAPTDSFAGTYGILTPNDRLDLDNTMMNTYGENNMNNALVSGFYPWCTLGRPTGSTGAYTCVVQRSRQVDGNGYYSVMQTAFGREAELGKVYQRVIFYREDRTGDNYGEWVDVSNTNVDIEPGTPFLQWNRLVTLATINGIPIEAQLPINNAGGGIVYAENYGDDFETALNAAIAASDKEGKAWTTIDCTYFTGTWTFKNTVVVDKAVTILLGNCHIISHGENVFDIRSNNVRIEGINRSTDRTDTQTQNMTIVELDQSALGTDVRNDSRKGYHIFSHGNKNCQYRGMFLLGKRTTMGRQCGNPNYPIDGWGGIYIEPSVPCTTISGNTVNATVLENLLIDGSKTHGIYLDTPILTFIKNCRLSSIAGHGVFINSGTTCTLESVYVASCQLAGFCLWGVTYCAVINSVAEYCGIGWWIRSSFSVSIFSPGVEHSLQTGQNLWQSQQTADSKYGFNITAYDDDGNAYRVNDVPNDTLSIGGSNVHYRNMFIGIGYLVTGGRNIDIYSPYVTGIGFDPGNNTANETVRSHHRYIAVLGNARAVNISNAGFSGGAGSEAAHVDRFGRGMKFEVEIAAAAVGVEFSFNPNNTTLIETDGQPIEIVTSNTDKRAQVLNLCTNAMIRFGNVYYTPMRFSGGLAFDGNLEISGALNVQGQISTETGILYKGYLREDKEAQLALTVSYTPSDDTIHWQDGGMTLALKFSATLGETDVTQKARYTVYLNGSPYATLQDVSGTSIEIAAEGQYEVYVVATYTDATGSVKTATSDTHSFTYQGAQLTQPTFIGIESQSYEDKSFTMQFAVRSSFEITTAGAAYSNTNTSPTTSQNDAKATSISRDAQDAELWHVIVTVSRANAQTTRYVRFYYQTNDTEAATRDKLYSDTFVVLGSSITPYQ